MSVNMRKKKHDEFLCFDTIDETGHRNSSVTNRTITTRDLDRLSPSEGERRCTLLVSNDDTTMFFSSFLGQNIPEASSPSLFLRLRGGRGRITSDFCFDQK